MKISDATYKKFRINDLTIKEYDSWLLLTRGNQATLGSLILINKNDATDFGTLAPNDLLEMGKIIHEVETNLKEAFGYDKINYQMLRMADPEVHFHIIPRYSSEKTFNGKTFFDQNWPGPFSLKNENSLTDQDLLSLHEFLKGLFQ